MTGKQRRGNRVTEPGIHGLGGSVSGEVSLFDFRVLVTPCRLGHIQVRMCCTFIWN